MKQLAQSLKSAIEWIHAGSVASRPVPGAAEPANDNLEAQVMRSYLQRARRDAGMDYQSAASKMWWLP